MAYGLRVTENQGNYNYTVITPSNTTRADRHTDDTVPAVSSGFRGGHRQFRSQPQAAQGPAREHFQSSKWHGCSQRCERTEDSKISAAR